MLKIEIPGYPTLCLRHLVLDYNGTLACDGALIAGVRERLASLAEGLSIHVLTADTFGGAAGGLEGVECRLSVLEAEDQDRGKLGYVQSLGPRACACIGNGRNDRLMLRAAGLGRCGLPGYPKRTGPVDPPLASGGHTAQLSGHTVQLSSPPGARVTRTAGEGESGHHGPASPRGVLQGGGA